MKRHFWFRLSAILVLVVFYVSTVPRDFIHLFTRHKDTVDLPYEGFARVSPKHTHCDFLRIDIAPYVAEENHFSEHLDLFFQELPIVIPTSYHSTISHIYGLRAPPGYSI